MCRVFVRLDRFSGLLRCCLIDIAPLDEADNVVCWYGVWEARHGVECVWGVLELVVMVFFFGVRSITGLV